MRTRLGVVCGVFVFLLLSSAQHIDAHGSGSPPFFKINGLYSDFYNVQQNSIDSYLLPQDRSPAIYQVDQTLQFEIDTTQLQYPDSLVKKAAFNWDFGDGSHATGIKNTHQYHAAGSYMLTITSPIQDGTLESVMIQVVPSAQYVLPQAVIRLNGIEKREDVIDPFQTQPGQEITFDASLSLQRATSSAITRVFWDFGDGESSTEIVAKHTYTKKYRLLFPALRVTDARGLISDTFTTIVNAVDQPSATPSASSDSARASEQTSGLSGLEKLMIVVALVVLPLILIGVQKRTTKRREAD